MAAFTELRTAAQWSSLWDGLAHEAISYVYIFKHSPYCPTSRYVDTIVQAFAEQLHHQTTMEVYRVDVVNHRPVSQAIADDTGVRHESPQVILLGRSRTVIWHASHHAIDAESLRRMLPDGMAKP
jgi:bacillithiol system protein YtxJ